MTLQAKTKIRRLAHQAHSQEAKFPKHRQTESVHHFSLSLPAPNWAWLYIWRLFMLFPLPYAVLLVTSTSHGPKGRYYSLPALRSHQYGWLTSTLIQSYPSFPQIRAHYSCSRLSFEISPKNSREIIPHECIVTIKMLRRRSFRTKRA